MAFLLAAFRKDLLRALRDPAGLLISIGIPVVITVLLRLAFGGGGTSPDITARLLVADRDDSFVSGAMLGLLGQGPVADLITLETVSEEEGLARIERGDASGFLVIPEGFGEAVFARTPVTLRLTTNPAQRILPGILEETLGILCEGITFLQRVLGGPLGEIRDAVGDPGSFAGFTDDTISALSVTVNRAVQEVGPYVFPPVIDLEIAGPEPEESGPSIDIGRLFLPTMLLLALLFVAQGQSDDFWKEREGGTLRRFLVSPRPLAAFLLGKVLATAALLGAVSLVAVAAARLVFGLEIENFLPAVAWATFSGVVLYLLFAWVQLLASGARGGNVLTGVLIFPLAMVGGSFFPFEAMPAWMAAIGRWTPNGWALLEFKKLILEPLDPAHLGRSAAVLTGFALVMFALTLLRLRSGIAGR